MNNIPTLQIYQPSPPTPPTPPAPAPVTFPTPLSYDFQVVEHIDQNNKITRVGLQVKVNQHDQYGNITIHGNWNDVPRVQLKFLL